MTGLEKIIMQIAEESAELCNEKMLKAREEGRRIVSDARAEADKEAKKIILDAEEKAKRIIASAKTSSESYSRTKHLEVRNAVVNDVIAAAYEEIMNFPDEKYFDLMYKLVLKYIEPGACEIAFNEKDRARLPQDFEGKINSEVYETSAVSVRLKSAKIDSGFVLMYSDYEINCSIKSMFEENMDSLKDILSDILFVEAV